MFHKNSKNFSNISLIFLFVFILLISFLSKIWGLGDRVMHHDESLHAYYAWELAFGEGYQHNPMLHGPLQMEAIALVFKIFGDSDFTARFLHALLGSFLVFLPYFFRSKLGNLGAIFSALLIAVSPSLLYFSRFARNDIIVVFLTLSLVVVIWNYIDSGKRRNLYLISIITALLFCTKETSYMIVFSLGVYLFFVVFINNYLFIFNLSGANSKDGKTIINKFKIALLSIGAIISKEDTSRYKTLLFLMLALVFPVSAGIFSVIQTLPVFDSIGLVLASADSSIAPIGTAYGGGQVIAFYFVLILTFFSIVLGTRYIGLKIWWKCFAIFYLVFITLFTVFFSDWNGVGSGIWRSLGYWIIQQDVARGGQPWFYYILLMVIYEFVIFIIGIAAIVYYLKNKDKFGIFLSYWVVITFVLYGIASEKMPWLLINMVLPATILGGKFLSDVTYKIEWTRIDRFKLINIFKQQKFLLLLPIGIIIIVFNIFVSLNLTYKNSDTPLEMLIYTQTSPDVKDIMSLIDDRDYGQTNGAIFIDSTNGFNWPWVWYLRNKTNVVYGRFAEDLPYVEHEYSIAMIHSNNVKKLDQIEDFDNGIRFKHRWWFPEDYKTAFSNSPNKIFSSLIDRKFWEQMFLYFLNRSLDDKLGSEDAYVFFRSEDKVDYIPKTMNQVR